MNERAREWEKITVHNSGNQFADIYGIYFYVYRYVVVVFGRDNSRFSIGVARARVQLSWFALSFYRFLSLVSIGLSVLVMH